jgi:hypothetical protein
MTTSPRAFVDTWRARISESLHKDSLTLRLLMGDRPRRRYHTKPATKAENVRFRTWKDEFLTLLETGKKKGWLHDDPYEGLDIVDSPPATIVYDETDAQYRARLKEWEAAQPRGGTVTFPVVTRRPEPIPAVEETDDGLRQVRQR